MDSEGKMTFKEFIKDITEQLEENPDWADKPIEFCTIDRSGLLYLSVYDSDDGESIQIDVGTDEDNEEHNEEVANMSDGMFADEIVI